MSSQTKDSAPNENRAVIEELGTTYCFLADGLGSTVTGLQLGPGSRRLHVALGMFTQAVEHFDAVAILTRQLKCGSALALVRPLMEAVIRGTWMVVITDEEFEAIRAKELPPYAKLVERIESALGVPDSIRFPKEAWKAICGFVHTGPEQLSARRQDSILSGVYRPELMSGVLTHCLNYAKLAASMARALAGYESALGDVEAAIAAAHLANDADIQRSEDPVSAG